MAEVIEVRPSLEGLSGLTPGATYWIPVMAREASNLPKERLTLGVVRALVEELLTYAEQHPSITYRIVASEWPHGAGIAYQDIGRMFAMVPPNVELPPELAPYVKGIRGPYSRPVGR